MEEIKKRLSERKINSEGLKKDIGTLVEKMNCIDGIDTIQHLLGSGNIYARWWYVNSNNHGLWQNSDEYLRCTFGIIQGKFSLYVIDMHNEIHQDLIGDIYSGKLVDGTIEKVGQQAEYEYINVAQMNENLKSFIEKLSKVQTMQSEREILQKVIDLL